MLVSWIRDPDRPKASFVYEATEDGNIEATGKVKYSEVSNWYLLEKELNNGKSRLYIVDQSFGGNLTNIYTDRSIGGSAVHLGEYIDETVLNMEHLEPYLITYNMVYDSYTLEDIDQLLGLIEANYEYTIPKESDKIIMKTNESNIGW